MSNKKRYDNRHCALFKGEYQRADNMYEFKWTDTFGKRHSIYAVDLDELRYKEQRLELNKLEGIKEAPAGLTVESLYETWKNLKRGMHCGQRIKVNTSGQKFQIYFTKQDQTHR